MTDSRFTRLHRAACTCVAALASAAILALAVPAHAQINLSGAWAIEMTQDFNIRLLGPQFGDYAGIPINAAGRAAALSYSADTIEELQRQCEPWGVDYLLLGPFGFQMWSTANRTDGSVQAWHVSGSIDRMPLSIWMDGRAPPSAQALRTFAGYAIGHWHGDTLIAEVSGMKDGYLTRNGIPMSNKAKITLFFTRHEQLLNVLGVVNDPVYLTQPYVLSRSWRQTDAGGTEVPPMTCQPREDIPGLSDGEHIATTLPGQNQLVKVDEQTYHLPATAVAGGAETMYPEFQKHLQKHYTIPTNYCKQNCCGSASALASFIGGPRCARPN